MNSVNENLGKLKGYILEFIENNKLLKIENKELKEEIYKLRTELEEQKKMEVGIAKNIDFAEVHQTIDQCLKEIEEVKAMVDK